MKKFIFATAVLVSTIVGVGMFSLPYAGSKTGFYLAAIFLIFLAIVMAIVHLFYGEIVSRTKEKHRLVGYAEKYLGKWGKRIVSFSVIIGFYGSLLVYMIVGGTFLKTIFSFTNFSLDFFSLMFFIIGAIVIYCGIKLIAELDFVMSLFLIFIVLLFLFIGIPHIDISNLNHTNIKNFFIPYGAILYSLAGIAAIPEIKDFFSGKNRKKYKKAILLGTLIPAVLYIIFMWSVIGMTGTETSPESIIGLSGILGDKVIFIGAIFGFLATITSFFVLGISLKSTFRYDFKIKKDMAWFLVCLVPLLLFILGFRNFVPAIVLLGSLMGAIEGSAIVLIFRKAKKEGNQRPIYSIKIWPIIGWIIIGMFVLGFISTVVSSL
ncbi:MAG: amino acid permease [Candidatus Portnoybacteria bacterium]|nr:amino acid permease [Candidatus Portnoybacteria bacterium]